MTEKVYTIEKSRRGEPTHEETGTLKELVGKHYYTLHAAAAKNRRVKVNPRTIRGLVKSLSRATATLRPNDRNATVYEIIWE